MIESHIIHEDVWMRTFLCTFEDEAMDWLYDLGNAPIEAIITFADFLRISSNIGILTMKRSMENSLNVSWHSYLRKKKRLFMFPLKREPIHESIKDQKHEEDFCDEYPMEDQAL